MQMQDLIKPLDQLTDEELQERIREIRHSRTVTRPAAQKHKEKAVKVKAKKETSKVDALLKNLSPEQIQQLLLGLGEG
jgi:hypothetical protein